MTAILPGRRTRLAPSVDAGCDAFREAIRATGLEPPQEVVADGVIHRFASDGRRGDAAGWYVLYDDGIPAGSFGCWRTDVKQNWSATPERAMNGAEETAYKAKMAAARKAGEEDKARRQSEAATEAAMIWEAAKPATDEHAYLARKGVKAHRLRQHADGRLVVPVLIDTALQSLQFIDKDGRKLFLTGGEVTGGYYGIGTRTGATALCVVEGFATGATVHEATGHPVAVAFNAGNLKAVVEAMYERYPDLPLIVCGDDDPEVEGNPGRTKATEAAQSVGARLAQPGRLDKVTDFNDLAQRYGGDAVHAAVDAAKTCEPAEVADGKWPEPPDEAAYYGLAGDIVRTIEPHTESDPVALLLQVLTGFGSVVGPEPHYEVEAVPHPSRDNVVLVGDTSKARKGTAWRQTLRLLRGVDEVWASERVMSGLSSGEGLIWAVRDPSEKQEPIREGGKKSGRIVDYEAVVVDDGVADKRLLVSEGEFASVLRIMGREGNTLSATLRQAWDDGGLRTLTKNSPAVATGAHISLIGHITREELLRYLDSTEQGNGFANRFLWAAVRRSKTLPEGGAIGEADLERLILRLKEAADHAGSRGRIRFDGDARAMWHRVYAALSDGKPGLLGAVTARGEAHVVRLALTYALLDCADEIRVEHLLAALAVWEYCERSAAWIFGTATGDPVSDQIMHALRDAPDGLTRSEVSGLFGRHQSAERIARALGLLESAGRVEQLQEKTGGRTAKRYRISAK